jgi:hypothetical protein
VDPRSGRFARRNETRTERIAPRIDEERLADDDVRLVVECTELKQLLRTTWTRPTADEQKRYTRGRIHPRVAELTAARAAC